MPWMKSLASSQTIHQFDVMKIMLLLILAGALAGCDEKSAVDSRIEAARETMLRDAIQARDKAETENRNLHAENQRMRLELSAAEGKVMIMEAKVSAAEAKVDNAYKLGWAARSLELLKTGK